MSFSSWSSSGSNFLRAGVRRPDHSGDKPARQAHLDHDNKRVILVQGVKDRLRSFDCSIGRSIGFLDSAESATPSPLAHTIFITPAQIQAGSQRRRSLNQQLRRCRHKWPIPRSNRLEECRHRRSLLFFQPPELPPHFEKLPPAEKGRDGKFTRTKQFCFTLGASQLADSRAGSIYRIRRDEKISMGARTESRG